jgi:hypothetical protein
LGYRLGSSQETAKYSTVRWKTKNGDLCTDPGRRHLPRRHLFSEPVPGVPGEAGFIWSHSSVSRIPCEMGLEGRDSIIACNRRECMRTNFLAISLRNNSHIEVINLEAEIRTITV